MACLHCEEGRAPFCSNCNALFHLLPSDGRCLRCFTPTKGGRCPCSEAPFPLKRVAAALDNQGPAQALTRHVRSGGIPEYVKGMAGFLAAQHIALSWPTPDQIIAIPSSPLMKWKRGYCIGSLLAKTLGSIFERPVSFSLRKKMGVISQESLPLEERTRLKDPFIWKGKSQIEDQTVLLVDDLLMSGATMREAGKALLHGYPAAIYGLTFVAIPNTLQDCGV